MVSLDENVALSASVLGILSILSIFIMVCIILVYWKYRANEKKKTVWYNSPSELRTGWLTDERKCLVPGKFSAKAIQPDFAHTSDSVEAASTTYSDTHTDSAPECSHCGKISFILRYLAEREELMVRLIQLEGFSSAESIYNADSAYVDVQLKNIESESKKQADNPPKLDIALQQVYYFIISRDQLFSYKLVFKVNTFDESFRRTVSGYVEVELFEELKKHIFTGAEVLLSKNIQPAPIETSSSANSGTEHTQRPLGPIWDEAEDEEVERTMMSSPLSWEDECNMSSKSSIGPYDDMSSSGVQWHRLSGDSWEEQLTAQWPQLSDSVVSVPSSFQFVERSVDIEYEDQTEVADVSSNVLLRRSISESYIPHLGCLSPPPKNFYHLVPMSLNTKNLRTAVDSSFSPSRKDAPKRPQQRFFGQAFTVAHRERAKACRKRSLSFPSLNDSPINSPPLVAQHE